MTGISSSMRCWVVPPCSNDHKYHHDNFACDTRYLFPSTTAYYVTTQTILSTPGSLAMFRRLGDIQTNLFTNLRPNLEYCFQLPPRESPSMIRIYFPSKKSGNGSPKWSYASAGFHDFAVTNHIDGFKSTMNASMMFPLE